MSENWVDNDEEQDQDSAAPSRVLPIVMLVLIAVAIGATLFLFLELRATQDEFAQKIQAHEEQIALLEGSVNRTTQAVDTRVKELRGVVESAEEDLSVVAKEMEQRVVGRTQTIAKDLEETKAKQQQVISEVGGRLNELKEVTAKSDQEIDTLNTEVARVQSEVEATRAELEKTIADLTSVRGDLGVQSGLIATNSGELQALRELGERNYYEFDLAETKEPQRVGNVQIQVRKINHKRNWYTLDLWADDRKILKRRKSLLEPVQFYVEGVRIPYEIVVNKIESNSIKGYLATPKSEPRRTAQAN